MVGPRQQTAFHTDRDATGRQLSASEREKLLRPYLPAVPKTQATSPGQQKGKPAKRFQHKSRVRPAIRHAIHYLLFTIIHTLFSIYIRVRQVYHAIVDRVLAILYYHHRTPELIKRDVKSLSKVPKHLSVILQLAPEGGKQDRLETLVNDACEVAAWSACAGVPMLSIYERTGKLSHCYIDYERISTNGEQASSNHPSHTFTAASSATSPRTTALPRPSNRPSRCAHHICHPTAHRIHQHRAAMARPRPHARTSLSSLSPPLTAAEHW